MRSRIRLARGVVTATSAGSYECFMEHLPSAAILLVFTCDFDARLEASKAAVATGASRSCTDDVISARASNDRRTTLTNRAASGIICKINASSQVM